MRPRPSVSVVMPFAGDLPAARAALAALAALHTAPGDQLILADNAGIVRPVDGIELVVAGGERSPAHARNAGAHHARGEWLLFLDADCIAPPDLLDRYFLVPVDADVGALAGEIVPAAGARPDSLAERYGNARSFLSQEAHLAHRYLPRAAAANLLVRRAAFEALGGFYEGLRAAEDTDFSWRLQQSGWRLELRPAAHVEHRYRVTVRALRRQWRGYAAGRAWLGRRYDGFAPEPAAARGLRRVGARVHLRRRRVTPPPPARRGAAPAPMRAAPSVVDRAGFLALDLLLAAEELAGMTLSNRPGSSAPASSAAVVLIAERFPADGDPLVEFAAALDRARVEASSRPASRFEANGGLRIDYREDDGRLVRATALLWLLARHPLRCARDRWHRPPGTPSLLVLAPVLRRLHHDPGARLHALGDERIRATMDRLAALAER